MKIHQIPRWLVWDYTDDNRKIPLTRHGQMSGVDRVRDFMSYEEAVDAAARLRVQGPAFVFSVDDTFGGVDIDNCLDERQKPKDWVLPILDKLSHTYMELSPGLRGIKVFGSFTKPSGMPCTVKCSDGEIEVYEAGRYFTFTGCREKWMKATEAEDCQDAVEWINRNYFPVVKTTKQALAYLETLDGDVSKRAAAYVESVPPAGEGDRNNQCFKLAGNLFQRYGGQLTEADVLQLVARWNAGNSPPLSEREVLSCVRSAGRNSARKPPKLDSPREALSVDLTAFCPKDDKSPAPSEAATEPQPERLYTVFTEICDKWKENYDRREEPTVWDCGFPQLAIGPSSLTVIGGGPGAGKTTWCMQLLLTMLENHQDLRALVVSVEVAGDVLLARALAAMADVSYSRLFQRTAMTAEEELGVERYYKLLRKHIAHRLCILDDPLSMHKALRGASDFGADIILLDYIQRVKPTDNHGLDTRQAVNATLDVARTACNAGGCVIAVSSLSRPKDRGDDYNKPTMTSFRESGELEYGADEAYALVRARNNQSLINVSHLKARYRMTEDFQMRQTKNLKFERVFANGLGDGVEGEVAW